MEANKLLRDLLKIPSPSGEEREIGNYLVRLLNNNYKLKIQIVNKKTKNFNILAYNGKPKILLNAHLDTVPGKLKVYEDKKFIYGRGACDTKASIVSMIIAAENLIKSGYKDIALLFNVNEESDFSGIKKALKIIPKSVEYAIIGEPTNLEIISGQKGILVFELKCRGKSAHSSLPNKGINAIELLIKDLTKIKKLKLPKNKYLGNSFMNIAKISGGISDNIIPDNAQATVSIRYSVKSNEILNLIKKNLASRIIKIMDYGPAFNKESIKMAKSLKIKEKTVSYFTEMYFLSKKAKCIVLGPGDIKYAHSKYEKINKQDIPRAIKTYMKIITYLNQQKLIKLEKE